MSSAVSAIVIATPTIMSQLIFFKRRFDKGVDNINNNPIYSLGNFDIAAGQAVKAIRAAKDINPVNETLSGAAEAIKKTTVASDVAKDVSTVSKTISGIGKGIKAVVDFTAANINPIICVTGLAKVMFGDEDDKLTATVKEGVRIGTMFGFENAYKKITGMPKISYKDGKQISTHAEGLYKKMPALAKYIENFVQKCNTTKLFNKIPLRALPPALKGASFVLASMSGYAFGDAVVSLVTKS